MIPINNIKYKIDDVLSTLSDDETDKAWYAARVKKYSNACGCGMGAVFLFVSLGIFIYWIFIDQLWENMPLLKITWLGLLFVFLSSVLGKLLGIGIARVKLRILYYSIVKKTKVSCQPVQNG